MTERSERFDSIQTLRFFAAAIVAFGHTLIFCADKVQIDPSFKSFFAWAGGAAVFVFFSISGFVITHAAQHQAAADFLKLRLLRIYPAYFLAVALTFLAKFILFGGFPTSEVTFWSLTLLPSGRRPYPLWIEWSLIYELFFYALFAAIWIRRSNTLVKWSMTFWLVVIVVAHLLRPDWADVRYPTLAQILFSARSIPFILGVGAYYVYERAPRRLLDLMPVLAIAAALAMSLFASSFYKILATSAAAMLLVLFASNMPSKSNGPITQALSHYGDYSYGLYLLHIPIITIVLSKWVAIGSNTWLVSFTIFFCAIAGGSLFGYSERTIYLWMKRRLRGISEVNQSPAGTSARNNPI